jgi:cyclohexanecarboxylate-CoA ligase
MEAPGHALARHARERPDALALIDNRLRLSWAEVEAWVDAAAGWLDAHGFSRGAPVLCWLPNCVEWSLFRLACERAGLFLIPVPASQGRRELTSIVERVRPVVMVSKGRFRKRDYRDECDEICGRLGQRPVRVTLPDDTLVRLSGPSLGTARMLALDELTHALPTSGSEGVPKLAEYTMRAACRRAAAQIELLELRADDVMLVLSHGTGPARPAWLAAPIVGACIVAMPVYSVEQTLQLMRRDRPTMVCATPAQLTMLVPMLDANDCSSVRIWYTSGAVVPPTLVEELETLTGAPVISTYGGADFGGWSAPSPHDPPEVRRHSVGRPRGGTEFRIVDAQGGDVAAGEVGELIGRGPCCVAGYLGDQGRSQWHDGWFYTGDLARRDENGNLSIVGRAKSVIVRGGDNILPGEVEGLLRTHPLVEQVAVVGVPDPVLGDRVCACVVPKAGASVDLESLRDHVHSQGLAYYKAPERLLLLSALPMISDKIDQRALASLAAGEAEGM